MKKRRHSKKNKISPLIILSILSCIILPSTYSRYIEKGSGKTQTSLAKWDISVSPNTEEELNLIAHTETTADYVFEITSTSEVASEYSITLTNVPDDVLVEIDNNGETLTADSENKIVIDRLGEFNVEDINTIHTHIITFITNNDTSAPNDKVNVGYNVLVKQRISSNEGE